MLTHATILTRGILSTAISLTVIGSGYTQAQDIFTGIQQDTTLGNPQSPRLIYRQVRAIHFSLARNISKKENEEAAEKLKRLQNLEDTTGLEIIDFSEEFLIHCLIDDFEQAGTLARLNLSAYICKKQYETRIRLPLYPPPRYGYREDHIYGNSLTYRSSKMIRKLATNRRDEVLTSLRKAAVSRDEQRIIRLVYQIETTNNYQNKQLINDFIENLSDSTILASIKKDCPQRFRKKSPYWISFELAGFGTAFQDAMHERFVNPGGFRGAIEAGRGMFFIGAGIETGGLYPRDTIETNYGAWYGGFSGNYTRTMVYGGIRIPFQSRVMATVFGGFSGIRLKPRVNDNEDGQSAFPELESVKVRSPENWFYGVDISVGIGYGKTNKNFHNPFTSGATYSYFFANFTAIQSDFELPAIGAQQNYSASAGFRFIFRWKAWRID